MVRQVRFLYEIESKGKLKDKVHVYFNYIYTVKINRFKLQYSTLFTIQD